MENFHVFSWLMCNAKGCLDNIKSTKVFFLKVLSLMVLYTFNKSTRPEPWHNFETSAVELISPEDS